MLNRARFLTPLIVSIAVTPILIKLAIVEAGAGHGTHRLAKALFPYTMLSTSVFESITLPFVVLAMLQFPAYGLLICFGTKMSAAGLWTSIFALEVVHVAGAVLAFTKVSGAFSIARLANRRPQALR